MLALLLALGLALLVWPAASDAYARWKAEGVISAASSRYEAEGDPACQEVKRQAQLYNLVLAGGSAQEEPLPYEQQLVFHGDPMISYLQVPSLGLKLPIYHGTSESALMAGVGHLETSSLPVGGAGCHCVLAGHSGMREARMFDGLERLAVGDRFIVWTLGEPYAYEVYGIDTVLPDDTDSLALQPGRDLCTLVTCTPYGVNSHRLLVHGERCEYRAADEAVESAPQVDRRFAPALIGTAIAAFALAAVAAAAIARRRHGGAAHLKTRL